MSEGTTQQVGIDVFIFCVRCYSTVSNPRRDRDEHIDLLSSH